jgi:hypothetical protein
MHFPWRFVVPALSVGPAAGRHGVSNLPPRLAEPFIARFKNCLRKAIMIFLFVSRQEAAIAHFH